MEAIRTQYKGQWFRSKLEAQWAKYFDYCGLRWYYEPEGFKLKDGTKYLPDFYVPDLGIWYEVKGIMTDKDMHKIKSLAKESGLCVAIGYADGVIEVIDPNGKSTIGCDEEWYKEKWREVTYIDVQAYKAAQ